MEGVKIAKGLPPNIQEIANAFGESVMANDVVFTYGDTIYNPQGRVSDHVVAHEIAHILQQAGNPEAWWKRFLSDPAFRAQQELEAYQAEWKFIKKSIKDRNGRAKHLHRLAGNMASPIYGNIFTSSEAKKLIESA